MADFEHGHALIIGIANYPKVRKLPISVLNDATDIYNLLCSPGYCGYPKGNVRLLVDEQASAENCREGFAWLAQSTTPEDTVFIYYSGHGGRVMDNTIAENYLLPYNIDFSDLSATGLAGSEVTSILSSIQAQKLVVVFDCCHSGGIGEVKSAGPEMITFKAGLESQYIEQLASGKGRVILASSREEEVSLVLAGMRNSLFTYHLLEGLKGGARTLGDGMVRIFELFDHVSQSLGAANVNMHPIFKANHLEDNFAICLYKSGKKEKTGKIHETLEGTVGRSASYSPTQLRLMIISSFDEDELMFFCKEFFPEVLRQFSNRMSLEIKANTLITFCERRGLLLGLIEKLKIERPNLFN